MITTLFQFANLLKDEEDLKVYFSPAKNPFDGQEEKGKVLVGEIEKGMFKGFSLENFKVNLVPKYLYREAKANSTNIVPTLIINTAAPNRTTDKFLKSIENYKLTFIDEEGKNKICEEIIKYDYNRDFSYLLTFRIDGNYFGDFDDYVTTFNDEAYNKYYKKTYGNTKRKKKLCALTGEESTVYGFVDTLGFTVNDISFRRNGFNANDAYKMFPVAENAISTLEAAKGILIKQLASSFFGSVKYAVFPHFVFVPEEKIAKEIVKSFFQKAVFNVDAKEDRGSNGFIKGTESILSEIIYDKLLNRSDIYYSILFFEKQPTSEQFKIFLELNDVLPSRISKVIKAKKTAEKRYFLYTSYRDTNTGNVKSQRITLWGLKNYYLTSDKNVQPAFYKLISSIFTGQPYDDSKLLSLVVETWKSSFKKNFHSQEKSFKYLVKYTLANLYFLHLLGIYKKQFIMNEEILNQKFEDAFSFIETHSSNYFIKEYLKGAFLFGCLVNILLDEQKPGKAFMKELNGLNIDKDLITKKFPKLINKLRQYDKTIPDMEIAASRYFSANDKVSKDEISFAFTLGLVLQKDFRDIYWANSIKKNNNIQNSDNDEKNN